MNCHRLWLKQEAFISHKFGGQKLKIKILEGLIFDESPLSGLQMSVSVFSLYPHMAGSRERESRLPCLLQRH